ncbi:MAG TPA: T9SS type A sorting domain-containing protein [Bacteroidia bacterium]|nr:T9SS type A sorting domain-containing protein [Bacteroidia bacterium]
MKKLITLSFILALSISTCFASTNVKGGIYSNATWTKANSPYIVTDTVVVFPGVTLTIQPGVIVKFDTNVEIEVRQATLIALGTPADSIIFTSNAISPYPGIYSGIYLNGGNFTSKFNYCSFYYANYSISHYLVHDSLIVKNSNFKYNNNGIFDSWKTYSILSAIDTCNFYYNVDNGLYIIGNINYCIVSYNGNGIQGGGDGIINNCIISYNKYYGATGSVIENCNLSHNHFGAFGPAEITNSIISYNDTGVYWGGIINNCSIRYNHYGIFEASNSGGTVKNSIIDSNNMMGVYFNSSYPDSLFNCTISHSLKGVEINSQSSITKNIIENNSTGIILNDAHSNISCNRICNNTAYGLQYNLITNTNISYNYWCTADSATTQALIYDGYNNVNDGLAFFTPIDSSCSPSIFTSINEVTSSPFINVYPNPATNELFINLHQAVDGKLTLTNVLGQDVYTTKISGSTQKINTAGLPQGVYFLKIESNGQVLTKKVLKI